MSLTEPLPPRKNRPVLVAMLFVASAISFWIVFPKRHQPDVPPAPDPTEVGEGEEAAPSPGPSEGGDRIEPPSSPPPRAVAVRSDAASDGVLRLLVLGDEQCGRWAAAAAKVLDDRLRASGGNWAEGRVQLSTKCEEGWTAASAYGFLESGGWAAERPELVLVSVGWHDSRAALVHPGADSLPVDGTTTWLAELAELSVLRDVAGSEHQFYLREVGTQDAGVGLKPLRHLEYLDAIGVRAVENDAAVRYVEQPAKHALEDRTTFATTAMRPQQWIPTVFGFEQQQVGDALFGAGSPIELSDRGNELVGQFVGLASVAAVLDGGPIP